MTNDRHPGTSFDYAGGYNLGTMALHNADGSPVQIKMTLNFLETELITKDHIEAGY